jgi:hypothetical protein
VPAQVVYVDEWKVNAQILRGDRAGQPIALNRDDINRGWRA